MWYRSIFAAAAAIAGMQAVHAGPQYVDASGYAAGGYDVVAYHGLDQAPVGGAQPRAVPGKASITAEYNGAAWAFASEANRQKFLENPEAYAPRFDGHCAYGVAKGGKVPGNPNLWRIVDGDLYLNITPNVVDFFEDDISGSIADASKNWQTLESEAASSKSWKALDANDGTYSTDAPVEN